MVSVTEHYEAYPYPERDPADEARRLIQGSPSHPLEIDHFLFGGARDWSRPLTALVAGGGTGDGLIQLAQSLTTAGKPYQITYIDLSRASRQIAEARAKVRGLTGITFLTGSLMEAPDLGRFDYIDCCGVLHHLPDPEAGFAALRGALAPGGGLGFMVYAPYGRAGVYPLQQAFAALLAGLPPEARLAEAKRLFALLPAGHPFKRNPHLGDHKHSDAGFYDLLLHGQDMAMDVETLCALMERTGWDLVSFIAPALYNAAPMTALPEGLSRAARMGLAERLFGTIKTHVGYAAAAGSGVAVASSAQGDPVPHLKLAGRAAVAAGVAEGKPITLDAGGLKHQLQLAPEAAPLIAAANGRRRLSAVFAEAGLPPERAMVLWRGLEIGLTGVGALLYSEILL